MDKHTQGPWNRISGDRNIYSSSGPVCKIPAVLGGGSAARNWENNAALIAAAPDLLEALTDALDDYDSWMKDADVTPNESLFAWTNKARAAIARARGEA